MGKLKGHKLSLRDYLALALSLIAAMLVWFIHNLSLNYSDIVQCTIQAECNIDGHSESASSPNEIAARCDMPGFGMIYFKRTAHIPGVIRFSREDMHSKDDETFYMTSSDLNKYFHEIFGEQAHLEYFVTDTVFFHFTKVHFKKVPVNPVTAISFKPQYMPRGELAITPDSVLVYGTESQLISINKVNTKQILLKDISSEEYGEVKLETPDGLRLSQQKVDYSIQTVRYIEQEKVLPVKMTGEPQGYNFHILPSTAKVRIRTVFPSNTDFSEAYVGISYSDFTSGKSGQCIGCLEGVETEVLYYSINPDVFECLIQ